MGDKLLNINASGKKIGNREKRLKELGKRLGIGMKSKALDKAIEITNKFLDMKENVKKKWGIKEE